MINTNSFYVRLILLLAFAVLTPVGGFVLRGAFGETQPHLFVMLVFSGCLTLLVGLVGLIGFVASFASKGASADKPPQGDCADLDEHESSAGVREE